MCRGWGAVKAVIGLVGLSPYAGFFLSSAYSVAYMNYTRKGFATGNSAVIGTEGLIHCHLLSAKHNNHWHCSNHLPDSFSQLH